jgi:hypothetical protein
MPLTERKALAGLDPLTLHHSVENLNTVSEWKVWPGLKIVEGKSG